jgi:hypothetical protein
MVQACGAIAPELTDAFADDLAEGLVAQWSKMDAAYV